MSLPKLPVPCLRSTLGKYKYAVTAFSSDEELAYTKKCIETVLEPGGSGETIQTFIKQRQETTENWAYDWWLHDMYLNNNIALPINSNPGTIFPLKNFTDQKDYLKYVALFIEEAFKFKNRIDRGLLPQDLAASREKGQPLCMLQYQKIFSSYRKAGRSEDELMVCKKSSSDAHIIVAVKGQLFVLRYRKHDTDLSLDSLFSELQAIYLSACYTGEEKVGLLTTTDRRRWGDHLVHLLSDDTNVDNFSTIKDSCFIVCLDQESDLDGSSRMRQMINGGGVDKNSANRWFDKTLQFIFTHNGSCGLCYEHSPAEGIVVVQMVEEILESVDGRRDLAVGTELDLDSGVSRKLEWNITEGLKIALEDISVELDRVIDDLDLLIYTFPDYGKELVKKFSVSPDVFIQVVLQLTYFRIHGHLVATYESASTRRFQKGRVDCIRAATPAALDWSVAMMTEGVSNGERRSKFYTAAKIQTEIMVDNILGEGIDVHLLGIREAAKSLGISVSLFDDPVFERANHFSLSTSQISTKLDTIMGYGPVVPDGYGASYNIKKNSFIFSISSFRSCEETGTDQFAEALGKSLRDTKAMLESF